VKNPRNLEKSYFAPAAWIAAGIFAFLLFASVAFAAPRAESALECGIAADMAIVARSLAQEEVQRPKADAIMARIYDVGESQRGQELMREIIEAAYFKTESSQAFAEQLFAACMQSGGDMNVVLGQRS
jgi:lipopolysaccharide export LptBFGC system permease protein LptF